jgi:heat shock protein HslJ
MSKRTLNHLLVLVAIAGIISCKNSGIDSKRNLELSSTVWRLESFETIGAEAKRISNSRVYAIKFLPDTIAQVQADCNTCTAKYQLVVPEGNSGIILKLQWCTEMYCGPASEDQQFLDGLRSASSYEIKGDQLRLYYDQKRKVLNFRAQP